MLVVGKDHTLFAKIDGYVLFQKKGPTKHKYVSVMPTQINQLTLFTIHQNEIYR